MEPRESKKGGWREREKERERECDAFYLAREK